MRQYFSPLERIAVDIMGPLSMTISGNKYLMAVMNYFSKWFEVITLPKQETRSVAEALPHNVVARHGVPLELHSDQNLYFESDVSKKMMILVGIKETATAALPPHSDGMVEGHNCTLN